MRLDLAPGNRFPDVELPDDSGHYRKLSELAGGIPSSSTLEESADNRIEWCAGSKKVMKIA